MIACGIATVPTRKDMLLRVVDSIITQVDILYVALNNYTEVLQELRDNPKIHCELLDNSLGDSAKFLHVNDTDGVYLSIDDDLLYPKGYVQYMISKIEQYKCIVTLHGRVWNNRPLTSVRRGFSLNYHCLHTYNYDTELDIGGTGVMAFNTSRFKPDIREHLRPFMADVWTSKQAHEQGVKIMGVAHTNTYLRYLNPQETIWRTVRQDPYATQVANTFLK
jgi:hypothetical protein